MTSSSKFGGLAMAVSAVTTIAVGSVGYAAYRIDWKAAIQSFVSGPGRTSRILLLIFVVFNWKTMPFAWTYRVIYSMLYHSVFNKAPKLGPKALFKPIISETKAPIFELDYNLHKSNSTYFADLDVSRTHLVSYLFHSALRNMSNNLSTKMVVDPSTGRPVKGSFSVALGSVICSFRREIPGFKSYEMWSRIACWDRKWIYIVTHILPKGTARPTEWLDPRFRRSRTRSVVDPSSGWEKKIYATAMSKYVFKVGRLTVHPAIALANAGLITERPGGWTTGPNQVGDESVDLSDIDLAVDGEWDWRRIEAQRRKGMVLAAQFAELDGLHETFDGGNHGAIAKFVPG